MMEFASLAALVAQMPTPRYAVVDGAQFHDLPELLSNLNIQAMPLYLEGADRTGVAAGPFVVDITDERAARDLARVVAERPAAVFWSWPDDLKVLHRHLRGLTVFGIPGDGGGVDHALLRLGDPHALAIVLPVLRPEQLAHFTGVARAVLLVDMADQPIRLVADPAARRGSGMIVLDDSQFQQVAAAFGPLLRARLLAHFAPLLGHGPAAELRILDAVERAEGYGLSEADQIWDFVALDVATEPGFERVLIFAEALDALIEPDSSPDLKLFYARQAVDAVMAGARG